MEPVDQPVSSIALHQGYEPQGVNYKGLVIFFYLLFLMLFVVGIGMVVLEKFLDTLPRSADRGLSGVPLQPTFVDPRLQPSVGHDTMPWQDLNQQHKEVNSTFNKMGWTVDPATGTPTIPASIVAQLSGQTDAGPVRSEDQHPAAELRIKTASPSLSEGPATPLVNTTQPARPIGDGK